MSQAPREPRPFLSAEWTNLVVVNWKVPPDLLAPDVPAGTTLDTFGGDVFVSLVAFLFSRTRLLGALAVPGQTTFEEVNLRFYVRREEGIEVRRGVSFIRETVPSRTIAATARWLYSEPYVRRPMRHAFEANADRQRYSYGWRERSVWQGVSAETAGQPRALVPGSFEEFILEHYWGYTRLSETRTAEYRVAHPPWQFRRAEAFELDLGDFAYHGEKFAPALRTPPHSCFVAVGSPIRVLPSRVLKLG